MDKLSYLYVVLSGSAGKEKGGEAGNDLYPIYCAAFECAMNAGCSYIEEGGIYLLSLFSSLFRISKSDIIINRTDSKNTSENHTLKTPPVRVPIKERPPEPKQSKPAISRGLKTLFKDAPEGTQSVPKEKRIVSAPDLPGNRNLIRDIYIICINSYNYDTNTKKREYKKSEELNITIYPMCVKESLLSAPITAIIGNGTDHRIYVREAEGKNSLVCDFGEYSFIIRGSFEGGEFKTRVTPYNSTADANSYDVIEKRAIKERPDETSSISHPVIRIGDYTEHIFPLKDENEASGLCPFALISESEGSREIYETSDLLYVIVQLGSEKYQIYAGWNDDGILEAGYSNISKR